MQPMESYFDNMLQEFYLTEIKELFDRCQKLLIYKEITLKNNVIVLSVPLVHHTELQNFLIAPRPRIVTK